MRRSNEELIILLAEHDAGHAYVIRQNLAAAGIINRVMHVQNGQEALDYINGQYVRGQAGPLVLLLDLSLPVVDGVEVLRQLKSSAKTAQIPVIMLASVDDQYEVNRCYQLGCTSYVVKPGKYDDFVDTIRCLGLFLSVVKVPRLDFVEVEDSMMST